MNTASPILRAFLRLGAVLMVAATLTAVSYTHLGEPCTPWRQSNGLPRVLCLMAE